MLGFAPDLILCISVTIYLFVYLARDHTWTMPLGEVCSRELPYLAITSSAQTTRHASSDSADLQTRGLAPPTMWRISSYSTGAYTTQRTFSGLSSPHARGLGVTSTRRTFGGSSSSRAWGLGATRHSAYFWRLVWLPYLALDTRNNSAYTMRKLKRFSRDKICFQR
jgi:hypothetical protein